MSNHHLPAHPLYDLSQAPSPQPDGSEAGDAGPPPSPSSTSQASDDAYDVDADLPTAKAFALAERRATLRQRNAGYGASQSSNNNDPYSHLNSHPTPASAHGYSPFNLPAEIVTHIFKFLLITRSDLPRNTGHTHLRNCILVCRFWSDCGVPLLWHRPPFDNLASLVKLIQVTRMPEQTYNYISFIRRLNFSLIAADLTDQLFAFMADCTHLERLALVDCKSLSDEMLRAVVSRLHNLLSIDASGITNITDDTLVGIASNCKRLQGINFTNCKQITSRGVGALGDNCTLLRRVKLGGCEKVDDEGVFRIIQRCPALLELDLFNCPLVSDLAVRHMWVFSSHIREVRLANCGPMTDMAFPAPPRLYSNSTAALDLDSPASLSLYREHLHSALGSLQGSDSAPASRGTSPLGLPANADGSAQGQQSTTTTTMTTTTPAQRGLTLAMSQPLRPPKLYEHLRLLDLSLCSTISDTAIEGIIACAPRIRSLTLAKCSRLTDESVFSIAKLKKYLQYLHLGHVVNITDRSVTHLVNNCNRLRYLDLAACAQLTDLSVTELAAKLPRLKRVGLVKVGRITDEALYALVERHLTLQRIHLSYCSNISVAAVFWLLERLPKVTHISLTGVPAFRRPELQKFCRDPPKEFSAHQRESFCVYSGGGVKDLQMYLRSVYSSEESAAVLGPVTPEVQRAIQLVKDNAERHRQNTSRRLNFNGQNHNVQARIAPWSDSPAALLSQQAQQARWTAQPTLPSELQSRSVPSFLLHSEPAQSMRDRVAMSAARDEPPSWAAAAGGRPGAYSDYPYVVPLEALPHHGAAAGGAGSSSSAMWPRAGEASGTTGEGSSRRGLDADAQWLEQNLSLRALAREREEVIRQRELLFPREASSGQREGRVQHRELLDPLSMFAREIGAGPSDPVQYRRSSGSSGASTTGAASGANSAAEYAVQQGRSSLHPAQQYSLLRQQLQQRQAQQDPEEQRQHEIEDEQQEQMRQQEALRMYSAMLLREGNSAPQLVHPDIERPTSQSASRAAYNMLYPSRLEEWQRRRAGEAEAAAAAAAAPAPTAAAPGLERAMSVDRDDESMDSPGPS